MIKRNSIFCLVVFISMSCLFAGCHKSGLSGLVPGQGQVLYDGQPLSDATVTFHAAETNSQLRGAVGTTDASGQFTLMTLNPNDGIEPGDYIVTVSKLKKPPKVDEESARKFMRGEGPPPPPPSSYKLEHEISDKYDSPKTSGLKITIGSKGDKDIKLELNSR